MYYEETGTGSQFNAGYRNADRMRQQGRRLSGKAFRRTEAAYRHRAGAGAGVADHAGITMALVTHEMGFAREVADRICFIDGGQILEDAPPEEFFSNPKTERAKSFLEKVL